MTIRVGSCFSGVAGFERGLEQAGGFEIVWQIELDDDAVSVLERHYPNTTRYRDITEVSGYGLPAIDVLVGGSPCQDLSVAGARAGLAGERSGLFFQFARLARECAASWFLFENVPGLLSSFSTDNPPPSDLEPGRGWESDETSDLGIVLDTFSECGYGWAYRVHDARFHGIPQRRRRVFIVGCLGDSGVRPAQVLFEPDSSPWDPAPSRTPRQGPAGDAQGGAGVTGFYPTGGTHGVSALDDAVPSLKVQQGGANGWGSAVAFGGNRTSGEIDVAAAVNAHGGPHGRMDFESETFIVDATNGTQSAGDPGTLGTEQGKGNRGQMVASPITASAGHHGWSGGRGDGADNLVVSDTVRSHPRPRSNSIGNIVAASLTAGGNPNSNAPGRHREDDENLVVAEVQTFNWQAIAIQLARTSATGSNIGNDITQTLDTIGRQAVAFHMTQDPINGAESPALGAGNENGCSTIGVATFDPRNVTSQANRTRVESGLPANTLHQDGLSVITPMTVRRLTPTECARLQGFPDDWVRYRADGSVISDGVQYRLLGNAVAVPVIRWIGRRLRAVMEADR